MNYISLLRGRRSSGCRDVHDKHGGPVRTVRVGTVTGLIARAAGAQQMGATSAVATWRSRRRSGAIGRVAHRCRMPAGRRAASRPSRGHA